MALQNTAVAANGFASAVRDKWLEANYMLLTTRRTPLMMMLLLRGNIKKSGYGLTMREPVVTPAPTGPQLVGVTNSYAEVDPQPMTGFTTATYPLAQYLIPVSYSDRQMKEAGGPEEMVNWQQAVFQNALERSMLKLETDLWAPPENALSAGAENQIASIRTLINGGYNYGGTAPTDGGYTLLPLQPEQSAVAYVGTSGANAVTTVGNIQRSAVGAGYWCPGVVGSGLASGNPAAGGQILPGAQAFTIQVLNDLYELAFQTGNEPDLILAPSSIFSKLVYSLTTGGTNGGQIQEGSVLAKFGFSSLRFRGANIVVDRRCPTSGFLGGTSTATANQVFCINTRHLKMRVDGAKPTFKRVVVAEPIQFEVGQWFAAITSEHLGNVHAMGGNYTV